MAYLPEVTADKELYKPLSEHKHLFKSLRDYCADERSQWYKERNDPAYRFLEWLCRPPLVREDMFPDAIRLRELDGFDLHLTIFEFSGRDEEIKRRMNTLENHYVHDLLSFLIMLHGPGQVAEVEPWFLYFGIAPWLVISDPDLDFPCAYPDLLNVRNIDARNGYYRTEPRHDDDRHSPAYLRDQGEWGARIGELLSRSPEFYQRMVDNREREEAYSKINNNAAIGPIKYLKSEIVSELLERLDDLRVVVGLIYQYTEGQYEDEDYVAMAEEVFMDQPPDQDDITITPSDLNPYKLGGVSLRAAFLRNIRHGDGNASLRDLMLNDVRALDALAAMMNIGDRTHKLPFTDEDVRKALRYVTRPLMIRLHNYWHQVGKHKPLRNTALNA